MVYKYTQKKIYIPVHPADADRSEGGPKTPYFGAYQALWPPGIF